jgi:hypothetical protein
MAVQRLYTIQTYNEGGDTHGIEDGEEAVAKVDRLVEIELILGHVMRR